MMLLIYPVSAKHLGIIPLLLRGAFKYHILSNWLRMDLSSTSSLNRDSKNTQCAKHWAKVKRWTLWEKARVGWSERIVSIKTCRLSHVKQITSPGWMHETSAQDWCTRMTQRDGMGSELGGGFRMGNTCKSMADSCQCMAKTTTIL